MVPQLGSTQGVQAGMVLSLLAVPFRAVRDFPGIKCDGVVVATSSGVCEVQVGVGMPWDSSGKGILPLSPPDGGRDATVWGGALNFGWKQEKIHILGGFESCLDRIAFLLLFCGCIAVRILMSPPETSQA